jgi:hypothetical protein
MKDKMFKRITKSVGEKQMTLASKVPQGCKINANITVLETNGKSKAAEGLGLVYSYAEQRVY